MPIVVFTVRLTLHIGLIFKLTVEKFRVEWSKTIRGSPESKLEPMPS